MTCRRAWGGDEWQSFAYCLVQLRHGHENVQIVPDAVKGDAGIEFIFVGGTLYQCYAPEETSDTQKAALAMKSKARRDLPKLAKYKDKISALLCGLKINRWILLCPFLDDKDVVADVRKRGAALKSEGLPFMASDFEALVHSQDDFSVEIEELRRISMMPLLKIDHSEKKDISTERDGEIGKRLSGKLNRGFKSTNTATQIAEKRDAYIRAHLYRENALADLRLNHPALWERSLQCLDAEEQRLVAVGATSTLPGQQLSDSVERIERSLTKDLPILPNAVVTRIAVGTVSDWLFRCPLDFPEAAL